MSADNGIYILKSKDEYRVIHAGAIDNLWWWDNKGELNELNPKELIRYFGNAPVFSSKEEAFDEAVRMYNEIMESDFPIIEYGIYFISGWEDKPFPEKEK